jgi:hypothetical protein
VETTQDEPQTIGMLGPDSGRRATQEEPFQAFVSEGEYRHAASATRNVSGYNPGYHLPAADGEKSRQGKKAGCCPAPLLRRALGPGSTERTAR